MSEELKVPSLEEKEAIRKTFEERMKKTQEIVEKQLNIKETVCPHGVPLSKSCKICDTVTPDQIIKSTPIA